MTLSQSKLDFKQSISMNVVEFFKQDGKVKICFVKQTMDMCKRIKELGFFNSKQNPTT